MKTLCYLRSDKQQMYELGQKLGLTGPALENFQYALGEVEVELAVDPLTGETEIIRVSE